jgi:hypothetical protein
MNRDERAKLLKDRKELVRKESFWCKDTWRDFEVYRVPVDALLLNADNRRFAAEKKLMEEKVGHALDPENNPSDEQSIISILLDAGLDVDGDVVTGKPSKDSEALKKDWAKRGQASPFWVRPDGMVRNGNRRLAMLKRMRPEQGVEGTRFVYAVILEPNDVNEEDLFEMEQREQLTENFKVRYTDINLLIALREAAEARKIIWTDPNDIERVAGELQDLAGEDKTYAAIQLRAIKYMDDYLTFNSAPGQYQKLIGQIERFRDVGKNMTKVLEDYPDEAANMLQIAFAAISAGNPHGDIRAIGKMFREDRDEYDRMLKTVFQIETSGPGDAKLESPDIGVVRSEEDSEDEDEEDREPAPVVSDYPAVKVKTAIKDSIDAFSTRNLEVASKLLQAWSRLKPLTAERVKESLEGDARDEVRKKIEEIAAWVDEIRPLLK